LKFLLFAFLLVLGTFFLVRYIEKQSMFFPMNEVFSTPDAVGLPYESVFFKTQDNLKIHAWFLPAASQVEEKNVVLFCHGNAGNISHRVEKLHILHELDISIFIFEYRGYGQSEGKPSEGGLYKDAAAGYQWLISEKGYRPEQIIVYGESIGGAVAIDLASRVQVSAVITEEAFTSIRGMVKALYPVLPPFMVKTRMDSLSKLRQVDVPKLFIHAPEDEIVPFWMGKELYEKAKPPKKFLQVRGSHNSAFYESRDKILQGIRDFFEENRI
jgi:uncharacterized protein